MTQKLAEREKEMQQLREATIKHEATVQTLNNQIRSLQQQLLESERKVPPQLLLSGGLIDVSIYIGSRR